MGSAGGMMPLYKSDGLVCAPIPYLKANDVYRAHPVPSEAVARCTRGRNSWYTIPIQAWLVVSYVESRRNPVGGLCHSFSSQLLNAELTHSNEHLNKDGDETLGTITSYGSGN